MSNPLHIPIKQLKCRFIYEMIFTSSYYFGRYPHHTRALYHSYNSPLRHYDIMFADVIWLSAIECKHFYTQVVFYRQP